MDPSSAEIEQLMMQYLRYGILLEAIQDGELNGRHQQKKYLILKRSYLVHTYMYFLKSNLISL